MRTLEEVETERCDCYERMKTIKKRLGELNIEEGTIRFAEEYPVGKRIMYQEQEYEISGYRGFWVYGRKINKDGTLSKQEKCLYGLDKR